MTPQIARIIFLISAASVACLLLASGSVVNTIAAIVVAAGAKPSWWIVEKTMLAQAFEQAATFLEGLQRVDEASQRPDQVLRASPAQKQRARRG
jgi:hypothetical protein